MFAASLNSSSLDVCDLCLEECEGERVEPGALTLSSPAVRSVTYPPICCTRGAALPALMHSLRLEYIKILSA